MEEILKPNGFKERIDLRLPARGTKKRSSFDDRFFNVVLDLHFLRFLS